MNKAIRNIPDAVVAMLKEQAAAKGLTLEAYLRLILIETAKIGDQSVEKLIERPVREGTTEAQAIIEFHRLLKTYNDMVTLARQREEFLSMYRGILTEMRDRIDALLLPSDLPTSFTIPNALRGLVKQEQPKRKR